MGARDAINNRMMNSWNEKANEAPAQDERGGVWDIPGGEVPNALAEPARDAINNRMMNSWNEKANEAPAVRNANEGSPY